MPPIVFDENVAGYPKMTHTSGSASATRSGHIAWSDLSAFILQLFPPSISAGGTIVVGVGLAFPGWPSLRAESLEIESLGRMAGSSTTDFATLPSFGKAKVTIQYKTMTIPEYSWSIGGEYLTMPTKELQWSADSSSVTEDVQVGMMVPTIEHEVKIPRVVSPPFATIRAHVGRVNDVDLVFPTGTAKPETVLFLGAHLSPSIMADGGLAWELSYKFSEKQVTADDQSEPGGWNHFYRPDAKGFYKIVRSGTTDGIYEKVNHANLMISGLSLATPATPAPGSGSTTPPAAA